jgi:cell division septum initiation protein DivIVA
MFNERKALQMTLQALLDQRMVLRRQYVDQDKQLGADIKQLLLRIRELDSADGLDSGDFAEEAAVAAEETPADILQRIKVRKAHIRHDYQEVAVQIKEILKDYMSPMSLGELCDVLKERHGVEFSSPYIGVQKTLKLLPQVKVEKSGRKLIFSL